VRVLVKTGRSGEVIRTHWLLTTGFGVAGKVIREGMDGAALSSILIMEEKKLEKKTGTGKSGRYFPVKRKTTARKIELGADRLGL